MLPSTISSIIIGLTQNSYKNQIDTCKCLAAILFSFRFKSPRKKGILSSRLWSINKYNILKSESPKMFLSKSLSIPITLSVCMPGINVKPWFALIFFFSILLYPKSTSSTPVQQAKMVRFWSDLDHWYWSPNSFFLLQDKTTMKLQLHANVVAGKQNKKTQEKQKNKKQNADIHINTASLMHSVHECCLQFTFCKLVT